MKNRLHATLAIPMALAQWTQVPFPQDSAANFASDPTGMHVTTQGTAGGYAYLFSKARPTQAGMKLLWDWRVARFPASTHTIPFSKSQDDFALKVGVLFGGAKKGAEVPGRIEMELDARGERVSYILFYTATQPPLTADVTCAPSPGNDRIVYCLRAANPTDTRVKTQPIEDLKRNVKLSDEDKKGLKILGFWIFADSDTTRSQSDAHLGGLKLIE